ncbi:MAG: hypothetical protein L3J92_00235 [Thermoplasmata archaeon]|nr:hypothetical protein [Thermoplasmata archaeon]
MRKIRQSFPKRREMLQTPFTPLPDEEFRQLVAGGAAIPGLEGSVLLVSKWRDPPGMDVDAFLVALRKQGSTLEARRFKTDVNIRVVRHTPAPAWGGRALPPTAPVHR